MRGREPDKRAYVDRDGVRIGYEVFGAGEPTVMMLPSWSIVPSLVWKAQVPYLARHYRVVTFDPRGNGRSDRPTDPMAYATDEFIGDALAVMDATDTERAVLVALSRGNQYALGLAADHPERVLAWLAIAPAVGGLTPPGPERLDSLQRFDEDLGSPEGWYRYNRYSWQRDYRGFAEFFFDALLPEPYSSKQWDDAVAWALQTTGEVLVATWDAPDAETRTVEDLCALVRCPVVVLHGTADECIPPAAGARLAELTGGKLVSLEGAGHLPQAREPVVVNTTIRDLVDAVAPPSPHVAFSRGRSRPRVLYLSSPIGLGHARRDLAIARQIRAARPDVDIQWLTQSPVIEFLQRSGEAVHPASAHLVSESAHIENEAGDHDLHAFQAIRSMDEVMIANFMVFNDLVENEPFDLWVGDEAWDLDHYLHENPNLKRAPFGWLTDFVGWLPMADGGDRETYLTADYNAEMVDHIASWPSVRDIGIFVGDRDDVVDEPLGPDLPTVRAWTEKHFEFSGYVSGFEEGEVPDREELRSRLGYAADEVVCVVSVGGSGVGLPLLHRVVDSIGAAQRHVPELRMVVVTGPRIDPETIRRHPGLDVRGFLPDLHLHHAACDIGIVQGGLTTTMELTAAGRPFLYFPLRHHFEQQIHVRHRLDRHGAGRCMDYEQADPDAIADALVDELRRETHYRPIRPGGALRAASHLVELL